MKNKTFKELIKMVVEDWKEQAKEMTDEYLDEDRSAWMKKFGRDESHLPKGYEINYLDGDIHTISIELEQIRRYGKIIYDKPEWEEPLIDHYKKHLKKNK